MTAVGTVAVTLTTGRLSGGVTVLFTVTVTGAAEAWLPAASHAVAVSVCEPFAIFVVSSVPLYGALLNALPRFAPSSLSCTPVTPTLSDAPAVTVMEPDTVAPLAGAVTETVGGVVSALA